MARFLESVAFQVASTLGRIGFCRTPSMGGRIYECTSCDYKCPVYNSCTDRHCPQCSGAKRADWVEKTAMLIQPNVTYFQVVSTLPEELSALALGNRQELYTLLFKSAWKSLSKVIGEETGMQPAAAMVLHTWNQRLGHHPHIHAMVPGSGPSLDGKSWIPCRMTKGTTSEAPKPFLVDNKRLGRTFRDVFIAGVRRLWKAGKIQVEDAAELGKILTDLARRDWVVFIEGPPTPDCKPEHVIKYLARYITGGPISNARLIDHENEQVRFWARSLDKTKKKDRVPVTMSGVEFTRNWSMHILPKGFTRSRFFGGWTNTKRRDYLELVASLQPKSDQVPSEDEEKQPSDIQEKKQKACPKCASPMELVSSSQRPSWSELFYGSDRPSWFSYFESG